jgi:hypothetical protein
VSDGQRGETRAVLRHFGKRTEAEKVLQPGPLHLSPSDACEVAGHQQQRDAG